MKRLKIKIEPEALTDIREITNWYNQQQTGLGGRFQEAAIRQVDSLGKNPEIHAIRYQEIRCVMIRKFPYMIHFYLNNENHTVEVLAIISTSRDPKMWREKIK